MDSVNHAAPHGWALDGFQEILVRGYPTSQILGKVGVLVGFAAAFFGAAVHRLHPRER